MGLAASQARLLGLTARKSNVEYKGQQINQERTALSNEVSGLYNEYKKLTAPVPPKVTDYQKTTYNVESTREDYEIESFSKILDGDYAGYYNVTLSYSKGMPQAYPYTAKDAVISVLRREMPYDGEEGTEGEEGTSWDYSYISFQFGTEQYLYDENDPDKSTITKITDDYEKYPGLLTVMESLGVTEGVFYSFMRNNITYYTTQNDLDLTEFENKDDKQMYYGDYAFTYQGEINVPDTVNCIAALTQESSGRLATIQFITSDDPDLVGTVHSIRTGTEDDEASYDDALNDYYYHKALYEKEVQRINLKTEDLQAQDRDLELQLNQLDTEQKAISTEMDSIDKVIEETIDTVFKTFE